MPTDKELMQQALDWADNHGEVVFAGGGWNAVNFMNDWTRKVRARLAQPEPESPYLVGARLFREGKGISFISTAVPSDADIGEALQGWEDARTAEEIAQPEPEPVAWMYEYGTDHGDAVNQIFWHKNLRLEKPTGLVRNVVPLYTAPPQREWQGLTAYEIQEIRRENPHFGHFACAIEANLKEKNA